MKLVVPLLLSLCAIPAFAAQQITFHVYSGGTITDVPVMYEAIFAAGAIPTGNCAIFKSSGMPRTTGVTVRTRHSDGSIWTADMFAVGSSVANGEVWTVESVAGACSTSGFLTKAQMLAFAGGTWNFSIDVEGTGTGQTFTKSCRTMLDSWDGTTLDDRKVSYWRQNSVVTSITLRDHDPDSDANSFGWRNNNGVMEVNADTQYKSLTPECHLTFFHSIDVIMVEIGLDNIFLTRRQTQNYTIEAYSGETPTLEWTKSGIQHRPGRRSRKVFWIGGAAHPTKVCTAAMTGANGREQNCIDNGGVLSQKYDISADLDYLVEVGFVPPMRTAGLNPASDIATWKATQFASGSLSDKQDYGRGQHVVVNSSAVPEDWNNELEGAIWFRFHAWWWLQMGLGGTGLKDLSEILYAHQFPGGGGAAHTPLWGLDWNFIEYGTPPAGLTTAYCGSRCATPANQTVIARGRWITLNSRPTGVQSSFDGAQSTNMGRINVGTGALSTSGTDRYIIPGGHAHQPELAGWYYWHTGGSRMFYDVLMQSAHISLMIANNADTVSTAYPYAHFWQNLRGGTRGYLWGQNRGRTWMLHHMQHAVLFARDASPEKEYLTDALKTNREIDEGYYGLTSVASYDATCEPAHTARTLVTAPNLTNWCYGAVIRGRDFASSPSNNPIKQPFITVDDTGSFGSSVGYSGETDTTKGGSTAAPFEMWYYALGLAHWSQLGFTEWDPVRTKVGQYAISWAGHPSHTASMSRAYRAPVTAMASGSPRIRVTDITRANPAVVETETAHGYSDCTGMSVTVTNVGAKHMVFSSCPGHTFAVDDYVWVSDITSGSGFTSANGKGRVIATTSNTFTVLPRNATPSGSYTGARVRNIGRICCPLRAGQWDLASGSDNTAVVGGFVLSVVDATHVIPFRDPGTTSFDSSAFTLAFQNGCGGSIGCNANDERQRTYITKYRKLVPFASHDDRIAAAHPEYSAGSDHHESSYTAKALAAVALNCDTSPDPLTGITCTDAWDKHDAALTAAGANWAFEPTWAFVRVDSVVSVSIATGSLPSGVNGVAYSQTLVASNCTGTAAWSVSVGSLPAWATLGSGTGTISGTPNAVAATTFTVRVTCDNGTADREFTLTIASAGTNDLSLDDTAKAFTWTIGAASPSNQTFIATATDAMTVTNRSITYASESSTGWLGVTPSGDGSSPQTYTMAITPTGLLPGVHSATVTIACSPVCDNGSQDITVTLTVSAAATVPLVIQSVRSNTTLLRYTVPYADRAAQCTVQYANNVDFTGATSAQDNQANKRVRSYDLTGLPQLTNVFIRVVCPTSGTAFTGTLSTGSAFAGTVPVVLSIFREGVTTFNVEYGTSTSYGSTANGTCTAGACTSAEFQFTAGAVLYFRYRFDGAGNWTPDKAIVGR